MTSTCIDPELQEHLTAVRSLLEARQALTENPHLVGLAALVEAVELIERAVGTKTRAKWLQPFCYASDAEAEAMQWRWEDAAEELIAEGLDPSQCSYADDDE